MRSVTLKDDPEAFDRAEKLMEAGELVPDDVVILGTMPQEACIGYDLSTRLVRSDWASWGDCSFALDTAHVSTAGDVAWFATVGSVEFDLTNLP